MKLIDAWEMQLLGHEGASGALHVSRTHGQRPAWRSGCMYGARALWLVASVPLRHWYQHAWFVVFDFHLDINIPTFWKSASWYQHSPIIWKSKLHLDFTISHFFQNMQLDIIIVHSFRIASYFWSLFGSMFHGFWIDVHSTFRSTPKQHASYQTSNPKRHSI